MPINLKHFLKICCLATILFFDSSVIPAKVLKSTEKDSSFEIEGFGKYTGSESCKECHERFYKLWAPSHHGLAMRPYTDELAAKKLRPQLEDIVIHQFRYKAKVGPSQGWVLETGPGVEKKYPIEQVIGGKNVYYFLTLLDHGKLQTLPVAYDVNQQEWFDTAGSGIRHFPDFPEADEPVSWKHWSYTFNTACYRCHVSQLDSNYDSKTDTYTTTWKEPGINCETCHGPGEEHIRICKTAPKEKIPEDLKLIRGGRDFTVEQNNWACAPCHAKMVPITSSFFPGESYFNHYDLTTLEHLDFYPDGRDLGENYTYTSWLMSPCRKSGLLSCLHCHTSSGRFRQKHSPNQACAPCHEQRIQNATAHTRHPKGSKGNQCISCHMPKTMFARMVRSDHSMLPPTPSATIKFKSPNACNICHRDKNPNWADAHVRQWSARDYQSPVLDRAELINGAREGDWTRLSDMLAHIENPDQNEVFKTSLIRLLRSCDDEMKWPAIFKATQDSSPLVRASSVSSLGQSPTQEAMKLLLAALDDEFRLVRIRAAGALAGLPLNQISKHDRMNLESAREELIHSFTVRPDHWASHYNLGNYYADSNQADLALSAYETSIKLNPEAAMPLVNAAMIYASIGDHVKAEELLNRALKLDPDSAPVHFNMGLLKAELKLMTEAEFHLRKALESDDQMHEAAYNLGVLITTNQIKEGIKYCSIAFDLNPNPKYAYTLAYFLKQAHDSGRASKILNASLKQWPWYSDSYFLLGDIYEETGRIKAMKDLYERAQKNLKLSSRQRHVIDYKLKSIRSK